MFAVSYKLEFETGTVELDAGQLSRQALSLSAAVVGFCRGLN